MGFKPEFPIIAKVCRVFSQFKVSDNIDSEMIKEASILIQRSFIRYKLPLDTDDDRKKLFNALYSFSTGKLLCNHLQLDFIEDFEFKFINHCNEYKFEQFAFRKACYAL